MRPILSATTRQLYTRALSYNLRSPTNNKKNPFLPDTPACAPISHITPRVTSPATTTSTTPNLTRQATATATMTTITLKSPAISVSLPDGFSEEQLLSFRPFHVSETRPHHAFTVYLSVI